MNTWVTHIYPMNKKTFAFLHQYQWIRSRTKQPLIDSTVLT